MQFRDSSLNDERMGCEEEEEECELYGDIEAFAVVLEHNYGDLSPIRGLVRKSKDVDDGCSYVAPRMENEITDDDLTMTRFYKLPGVMDEMIDMATKTEIMFSSSKREEEEENPIVVFIFNSNEGINLEDEMNNVGNEDDNGKRGKRDKKSTNLFHSPFTERTSEMLNKSGVGVETCRMFDGLLRVYTNKFRVLPSLKDVGLVKLLCSYLSLQNHSIVKALTGAKPHVMNIRWCIAKLGPNCGLYLIRPMESYMGEGEGRWDSGFTGKGNADNVALMNLRSMYLARMMKTKFNVHKKC
ncbi:unnamed protein product [Lactuca saligna]|uniref:Uncharacterized protein n=1 Tax=Lactuca saligna TaxID=75948 RepID=A0AA36E9B8_LACSI|nr:unnamed protein product [Lactuca saligna]